MGYGIERIQIHLMLLFIMRDEVISMQQYVFKYISCYSLSLQDIGLHCHIVIFKYISCYSLSTMKSITVWWMGIQIHLMLLFIRRTSPILCSFSSSNTSHVTLYQGPAVQSFQFLKIQIHLMLLFIGHDRRRGNTGNSIQIHLMLLFIATASYVSLLGAIIQIHLMLLFIAVHKHIDYRDVHSNTSHVTLYPWS